MLHKLRRKNNHPLRWQHSTVHNVSPEIQLPIIIASLSRLSRDLNFSQWMHRTLLCMRIWFFSIFTNLNFSAGFAYHRHDPKTYLRPERVKPWGLEHHAIPLFIVNQTRQIHLSSYFIDYKLISQLCVYSEKILTMYN